MASCMSKVFFSKLETTTRKLFVVFVLNTFPRFTIQSHIVLHRTTDGRLSQ
jgi:hypothetical protein